MRNFSSRNDPIFLKFSPREIKRFSFEMHEGSRVSEKITDMPGGFGASSRIAVPEREKAPMDEGERSKRGSRANRRDKKLMHVLLPAVRRLQSDNRFHGARLIESDVNSGSSVGSSTR